MRISSYAVKIYNLDGRSEYLTTNDSGGLLGEHEATKLLESVTAKYKRKGMLLKVVNIAQDLDIAPTTVVSSTGKTNKLDVAMEIYATEQGNRQTCIERFMAELHMSLPGARTYFYTCSKKSTD